MSTFDGCLRIISGTSQHPKNVRFVGEFWRRTYDLGAIRALKKISAIAAVDVLLSHDATANKPMWARHAVRRCVSKYVNSCVTCRVRRWETLSSSLYCSVSPDTLQPVYLSLELI